MYCTVSDLIKLLSERPSDEFVYLESPDGCGNLPIAQDVKVGQEIVNGEQVKVTVIY